ncbi:unnamed protein product [Phytophthora fragariaefolia]|uniref:Unnamed protein product n=1 Tax=Phytophthora fragariaefolia TaxID=1490495 RepID=A0A9W6XMA3_9STRA|nr:unnamed protein product [Phytophthora fragariaefolia]
MSSCCGVVRSPQFESERVRVGPRDHTSISASLVSSALVLAEMDSNSARSSHESGVEAPPDAALRTPDKSDGAKPKRKTKRLTWTDELHFRFVSAVFERALYTVKRTENGLRCDRCVPWLCHGCSGGQECVSESSAGCTWWSATSLTCEAATNQW